MSLIDKAIAAITPPESQEARDEARAKATAAAGSGDWLSMILDHHRQIESAFAQVKAAPDAAARTAAQKALGVILMGHAIAEEAVIYPGMAQADEKGHAQMGYTEQVVVKMEMAKLEMLEPMSQDYLDKLEHIQGAVAHHMFEEEGTWFLDLKAKAPSEAQAKLTQRYREEFDRYVGDEKGQPNPGLAEPRSWDQPQA